MPIVKEGEPEFKANHYAWFAALSVLSTFAVWEIGRQIEFYIFTDSAGMLAPVEAAIEQEQYNRTSIAHREELFAEKSRIQNDILNGMMFRADNPLPWLVIGFFGTLGSAALVNQARKEDL